MAYTVLARAWRPKTFDQVVGQSHVVQALSNALTDDRMHHAILFTGTRGVGKTTLARIVAKALNCEQGVSAEPCGECPTCIAVDEGRFVDLIEVDAASRTKVDETRELLDNVQYAATMGRYKVYLIDEVHMLSKHSFNALLKTLEEPPAHVKFLFATTDPDKLPLTVLSRCLQFNLTRLSAKQIAGHLQAIATEAGTECDESALLALAKAADGSMRDALSLTDQALAFGQGKLLEDDVRTMLGTIDRKALDALVSALIEKNAEDLMQAIEHLDEFAPDYTLVLNELAEVFQKAAMAHALKAKPKDETLGRLVRELSPEALQLLYQISIVGKRDLAWAPSPRVGFDMALLRMLAFAPAEHVAQSPPTSAPAGSNNVTPMTPASASKPAAKPATKSASKPALDATPAPKAKANGTLSAEGWSDIIDSLKVLGATKQMARFAEITRITQTSVELLVEQTHAHLVSARTKSQLKQALSDFTGNDVTLTITAGESQNTPAAKEQAANEEQTQKTQHALANDPVVQALQAELGATLKT